jgi:internalin A
MPATHQFFLTKRSLYVLVLDAQQGTLENRVEYWLKLIHNVGGDSPVLVVINKSEEPRLAFNRKGLSSKYPSIKAFFDISCKENQGLDLLNHQIAEWVDQLEHVHDPFPVAWFKIKDQLGNLPQDDLRYEDYVQLCQQEHLMDTTSQRTLLGFLHDLGIVLNFRENRLHSQLNETHILKPEWVMQGIYKIMNSQELLQNKGVLAIQEINNLLDSHRYPPPKKQHLIVEIMEKFELCFPLEERQQFLIPESLPKEQPDLHWDTQNSLAFQYHYDVLPSSIMSRFMVRLHRLIHHQSCWYTGVVLTLNDNQALVTADLEEKKIFIWVTGNNNGKRALLAIIRSHFDHIHQSISKIRVTAQVPYKNTVIPYQNLLKFMEKGIYTPYLPEVDEVVDVITLLAGIDEQLLRLPDKNFEDLLVEPPQSPQNDRQALPTTVRRDDNKTFWDWLWIGEVWLLLMVIIAVILYYFSKSSMLASLILGTVGSVVATWVITLRGWKSKPTRT